MDAPLSLDPTHTQLNTLGRQRTNLRPPGAVLEYLPLPGGSVNQMGKQETSFGLPHPRQSAASSLTGAQRWLLGNAGGQGVGRHPQVPQQGLAHHHDGGSRQAGRGGGGGGATGSCVKYAGTPLMPQGHACCEAAQAMQVARIQLQGRLQLQSRPVRKHEVEQRSRLQV
jgi:hypothetical protein